MTPPVTLKPGERFPLFFIEGNLPQSVAKELDNQLSYQEKGKRDGKNRLLQKTPTGTHYFPSGLLFQVKKTLEENDIPHQVIETRKKLPPTLNLTWRKYRLRPYQTQAVNTFLQKTRGTISLPTGTGKTLIGLRIIYQLKRPTLITIHQKEVADQWVQKIKEVLGVNAAQLYGGKRQNGPIQVALYQSIYRDGKLRKDVKLNHDFLIADEVHRVGAKTFQNVAKATSATYRLGLSATPKRQDGADILIWAGTGPIIQQYPPEWMVEHGYLANPVFKIYDTPKAGTNYPTWRQEYESEIVENPYRNHKIAQEATRLATNDRTVYIHVERIKHGEKLESMIPNALFVHGNSKNRTETVNRFRQGKLNILISTLLGEGFDAPLMDAIIMAGGLKSEVMTIQKIGRALRPGGKGDAHIIDFRDKGRYVGKHFQKREEAYKDYYGRYYRPSLLGRLRQT